MSCFIPFSATINPLLVPQAINDPFDVKVSKVARIAIEELQVILTESDHKWKHNFGLTPEKKGPIKGKMFGVLVVENTNGELGYLCTFSGKFADVPHPEIFVPSLFKIETDDYFINKGMTELSRIGEEIERLKSQGIALGLAKIRELEGERKLKSFALQRKLFDQYNFLNKKGETKGIWEIFKEYNDKKPASGAGECAAPKLLQYAFHHKMKPLAINEFWWGMSTKSELRKHGQFYPACEDKCRPILEYMLS